ncbi:hypothetical protein BRADI_2g11821v3 [Brachypodium distachyon]|uniref:Uncharacterized protein n=1 Tax=Brachypodium distachyon TaxID=15368 RepID=A0A0Q3G0J6_BRADI|nr:hypothetical protein BRADI_2g11821v3 [Brachypodium distachyon]
MMVLDARGEIRTLRKQRGTFRRRAPFQPKHACQCLSGLGRKRIGSTRRPIARHRRGPALGRRVPSHNVYPHLFRRPGLGVVRPRRRRRRLDVGAAERARGVAAEPRVDALDVEPVAAPRQRAGLLALLELREAHRAVVSATDAAARAGAGCCRHHHRERAEDRGVQPPRARRIRCGGASAGDVGQAAEKPAAVAGVPAPAAVVQVQGDEGQEDARERACRGEQDLASDGVTRRRLRLYSLGHALRRARKIWMAWSFLLFATWTLEKHCQGRRRGCVRANAAPPVSKVCRRRADGSMLRRFNARKFLETRRSLALYSHLVTSQGYVVSCGTLN